MIIRQGYDLKRSALYRIDPRLKVGGVAWLTLWIAGRGWPGLLVSTIGCFFISAWGRVPFYRMKSTIIAFLFLSLFYGIAMGWIPTEGWKIWKGYWSFEGILQALLISWRIGVIFWITILFLSITPPVEQGIGISYFLSPLLRLSPKMSDFILLIVLTFRFIPVFIEEGQLVWRARILKGPWPRSLTERLVQGSKLLTAMILLSLRRAEEVGENLLARGYTSGSYWTISYGEWKVIDGWALAILLFWPVIMRISEVAYAYTIPIFF